MPLHYTRYDFAACCADRNTAKGAVRARSVRGRCRIRRFNYGPARWDRPREAYGRGSKERPETFSTILLPSSDVRHGSSCYECPRKKPCEGCLEASTISLGSRSAKLVIPHDIKIVGLTYKCFKPDVMVKIPLVFLDWSSPRRTLHCARETGFPLGIASTVL